MLYQQADKRFIANYLRYAFGYDLNTDSLNLPFSQWMEVRRAFWSVAVKSAQAGKFESGY